MLVLSSGVVLSLLCHFKTEVDCYPKVWSVYGCLTLLLLLVVLLLRPQMMLDQHTVDQRGHMAPAAAAAVESMAIFHSSKDMAGCASDFSVLGSWYVRDPEKSRAQLIARLGLGNTTRQDSIVQTRSLNRGRAYDPLLTQLGEAASTSEVILNTRHRQLRIDINQEILWRQSETIRHHDSWEDCLYSNRRSQRC